MSVLLDCHPSGMPDVTQGVKWVYKKSKSITCLSLVLHHRQILISASIIRQGVKRVYKKSITYLSLVLHHFEILTSGSILRQGVKKV